MNTVIFYFIPLNNILNISVRKYWLIVGLILTINMFVCIHTYIYIHHIYATPLLSAIILDI